ncbi:RNA-binding domain-containing protein [Aliiroseovarius sp. F47248L]|uniref:RNA-binding domain-containing protein n=1 Tax=Aliiroseovarius sp. F47248L TaxID=2926420 RepID=UPI001FF64BFA|nr:RNA-binding domain-containing protein [Aliiroseovarius sp. F47248L]MCK0139647.1 putative DNA binding domain-containing protein [Aliiroseovarius sp. F47248L]
MDMGGIIEAATSTWEESDILDFKREFSPHKKAAFWAETVKDIIAFANTRGGILLFGVNDDGSPSEIDCTGLLTFDTASIADQIKKYTGCDFALISILSIEKESRTYPAIAISPVDLPIVFTKVGTYETRPGSQKTAFSVGTVYFRHGAKSEPCTRDDLKAFLDRRLDAIRKEWLGNIRQVVEAPFGTNVVLTHSGTAISEVNVTDNPDAPSVRIPNLRDKYPYRQQDVIKKINEKIDGGARINTHDIQCIKFKEGIDDNTGGIHSHRPHAKSSPQYSSEFIDLVCSKYEENNLYFKECRKAYKEAKY